MTELQESRHKSARIVARERPELLMFCGAVALIGHIVPLITIVWADIATGNHDFIADSISDLARGPHRYIMDVGFYAAAGGLMALAIGCAHAHLGRTGWSLGILTLSLCALVEVMLGLWDAFGATANGDGMSVHTQLSFGLAPLYVAGPIFMASAVGELNRYLRWSFWAAAFIWLVFAALFKLTPTNMDGIFEKIAFAGTYLWTLPLSWVLWVRGYERSHRLTSD
ncbi:DUF998 domain-containing protein [Loktanella sp. SALINAS62]|uniref:DUF998 domain-containing protein n=1 Tax=Loktanella sp. SALINAS62 TaxID=2706124 RepID=UPI001B8BD6A8|nr:DUF998 domain-containing protein [Loktanella sp. SALINAS62]MBS1300857.1 DUF998 domain-containing protein [Loktanella sp. SALINAS62]